MLSFYDAHAHQIESQEGGFLIALEGTPKFDVNLSNIEVLELTRGTNIIPVEYVCADFQPTTTKVVKYHARREGFSVEQVANDIRTRQPKIAIIDTLNHPFWQPSDYLRLVIEFPKQTFLFCHAGGYDVLDFVKYADFYPNVWIDFSFTHQYFGWCGDRTRLPHVCETMDYAFNSKKISNKILFGTDNGFCKQLEVAEVYAEKFGDQNKFFKENFIRLVNQAGV